MFKSLQDLSDRWADLLQPGQPPTDTEIEEIPNLPRSSTMERVATWTDFKGNEHAVNRLRRTIKAARIKRASLPNTLLYGPAGCGKTTLARILATEWEAKLFEITGSSLQNQLDLVKLCDEILYALHDGLPVIVFVDEIHGITSGRGLTEDTWLPLLEENVLHHSCAGKSWTHTHEGIHVTDDGDAINGVDVHPHTVQGSTIVLKNVTWIGATTDPGMLHDAIRRRFPLNITLDRYSKEDIFVIVQDHCRREGIKIDMMAAKMIADRSRYRPAIAVHHLLRQCVDEAILEAGSTDDLTISTQNVTAAMRLMGVKEGGLKIEDVAVLKALAEVYPKGLGIKSIAGSVGMASNTVSEMVLPFLQEEGLVKTTHKRFLTEKGKSFVDLRLAA